MKLVSHPRLWSVDLHIHTSFSKDCTTSPAMAIELARRKGLDAIAVTDHETVEGGLATVEANRHSDFMVIPGAEIKTDLGDLIGLFLVRPIRSRKFALVLEEIADQGGASIVPHPLRTFRTLEDFIAIRKRFQLVDAWEIMNGRYNQQMQAKSLELFRRLSIANASSGSDAHMPWEIGKCRTLLQDRPANANDFRRLIQNGFCTAEPRNDLAVACGIYVANIIRDAKARKYVSLMTQLALLPRGIARKAVRSRLKRRAHHESSAQA